MKIGVFDSGLGGVIVLRELKKHLPRFEYVYLGDTKNMPYGEKTQKQIYTLTQKACEYLFKQDCALIIVACNTASSQALRKLQQEWLPKSKYSDRKILGIIRPTVEMVPLKGKVGLIGTRRTIDSQAYKKEFQNTNHKIELISKATPKLATMVESGEFDEGVLAKYLQPFKDAKVSTLVLACTHYGELHKEIAKLMPKGTKILCQEQLLPGKLKTYLSNHPELSRRLSKKSTLELQVTKRAEKFSELAREWFKNSKLVEVKY